MVVLRTQNFLSPAALGSGTGRSSTNAKFSSAQPRVVMLRTQNFLSPAARVSGTRGIGMRGSGRNAKFSKSNRAW